MNMKKISVDTWIQLLGMVGVLGGLVFVGLEMQLFRFPVPDLETLSEEERIIIGQLTLIRSVSLENAWQQFNLGMIPEETIETTESRMISMYDNCKRRSANCLQTGNRSTSTKSTMNKLLTTTLLCVF